MRPSVQSPNPSTLDAVAGALSDGTRRSILRLVRDGEHSAGEIASQFPHMTRPAVSQHLKVLHQAGLVSVRSEGKFRLFQARAEGMADMWRFVDEMWTDRLERLKLAAERAEWPQRQRAGLAAAESNDASNHRPTDSTKGDPP
ncbi:MAG: ArsR/SmtB family transcription factor [Acidimicrobiales bacterium]